MSTSLTSIDEKFFFSKNDPFDLRLGDFSSSLSNISQASSVTKICILGYPDDEGVDLNGGRLGASQGPREIRKVFYKTTWPFLTQTADKLFVQDLGDIQPNIPLHERHEMGKRLVAEILNKKIKSISLGGGHDYGYADGAAFIEHCLNQKTRPLLINFDAHLDVRPIDKGLNSGTPFYRLLTKFKGQFDFVQIGQQILCNSQNHWSWAQDQGAQIISYDMIRKTSLTQQLKKLFETLPLHQPCFISLDIDAFSSDQAPGCSQSWPTGLGIDEVREAINMLYEQTQILGLGIYEVSPPLDSDNRTAKLAAVIMHDLVRHVFLKA